jgi:hypothetical protein
MNEAKRSATVGITSKRGFEWLFSIREETSEDLLKKMEQAEEYFVKNSYTPTKRGFGAKKDTKPIEYGANPCPICGKRTIIGTTKDGRRFEKCETQKYNFTTKQKSGCEYFKWL